PDVVPRGRDGERADARERAAVTDAPAVLVEVDETRARRATPEAGLVVAHVAKPGRARDPRRVPAGAVCGERRRRRPDRGIEGVFPGRRYGRHRGGRILLPERYRRAGSAAIPGIG